MARVMVKHFAIFVFALLILVPAIYAQTSVRPLRDDVKTVSVTIKPVESDEDAGEGARLLIQQFQQKRDEIKKQFKDKLLLLKDARKKEIVDKINTKACEISQRRMAITKRHLLTMDQILDRLTVREAEAKARGKDVTGVDAAITSARTAITDARTAATAFSEQPCDITISGNDTRLGPEVKTAIEKIRTDLKNIHDKEVAARKAVSTAISTLGKAIGETPKLSGTPKPEEVEQ